eukprot:TRINITY_DN6579_c0_g1_i2.p1 TRINITY_DN6579_c0_g1~~TRINITY_DN6579_c0_g1_i2.p1  ORF type:complete len:126 (-),score=14.35 TRINITY_DN6579_c0_g1_i2:63-440(-)
MISYSVQSFYDGFLTYARKAPPQEHQEDGNSMNADTFGGYYEPPIEMPAPHVEETSKSIPHNLTSTERPNPENCFLRCKTWNCQPFSGCLTDDEAKDRDEKAKELNTRVKERDPHRLQALSLIHI